VCVFVVNDMRALKSTVIAIYSSFLCGISSASTNASRMLPRILQRHSNGLIPRQRWIELGYDRSSDFSWRTMTQQHELNWTEFNWTIGYGQYRSFHRLSGRISEYDLKFSSGRVPNDGSSRSDNQLEFDSPRTIGGISKGSKSNGSSGSGNQLELDSPRTIRGLLGARESTTIKAGLAPFYA